MQPDPLLMPSRALLLGLLWATGTLLWACDDSSTPHPPEADGEGLPIEDAGPPEAGSRDAGPRSGGTWAPLGVDLPQGLLLSVWGRAADEVYFAGGQLDATAIGRWDGQALSWMDNPGATRAWWIFGFADPPVTYVVGERGLGLIRRGQGIWEAWDTGLDDATLYGIWGTSPDDLWVVGGDLMGRRPPVLRRWRGGAWSDAVLPSLEPESPDLLFKVWGAAADDVYVAGDRGVMLHFDGQSWARLPADFADAVVTVHGRDASDVWAVGGRAQGAVLHLRAGRWTDVSPSDTMPGLTGVFADRDGTVLVSGDRGLLMERGVDLEWRSVATGTIDLLHAVWAAPNGERWAVGGNFLQPFPPHHGIILHGTGPLGPSPNADAGAPDAATDGPTDAGPPDRGAPPDGAGDADATEPDGEVLPPDAAPPERCRPEWIRGQGEHRLYLQGRQGEPDECGRYPFYEDELAIVHGEHYLLGVGAFAEFTTRLCGDINGNIYFYLPNNDDPGSVAHHELFLVHNGVETLIAETTDMQAGMSGYNPFTDRVAGVDLRAVAGDELRLRSTNMNGIMYSVMIFRPPSEYMSYVEIQMVEDGPPVDLDPAPEAPQCTGAPICMGLEVGQGAQIYEPMDEGGEATLVLGPQGSWMLMLSLETEGMQAGNPDNPLDPDNPLVALTATFADDGQQVGNLRQRIGFAEAGGRQTALQLILTVNPNVPLGALESRLVQVDATVTDRAGNVRCGQRLVQPVRR